MTGLNQGIRRKRRRKGIRIFRKKRKSNSSYATWRDDAGPDFDCAVAVWLHELKTMSEEITAHLNFRALEYGCVSRCYVHRSGTHYKGVIFLFQDRSIATQFCTILPDTRSPHGNFPYKTRTIGSFLQSVLLAESAGTTGQNTNGQLPSTTSAVIIRNLQPTPAVLRHVVRLCSLFGDVLHYEEYRDLVGVHEFRHVAVTYRTAVEAFAAQLGLDGKWIEEQEFQLEVEVLRDGRVKCVISELLKRNKMIFQP